MIDQLREIERQEQEERKREEQQKVEEEKKRAEELVERKKTIAASKKQTLPDQPEEKNADACTIVFRLPSGDRETYRFLKHVKVGVLYDFVDSLGDKVKFETPGADYTILQSMPRKEFVDNEQSLQEAGLFPRAML